MGSGSQGRAGPVHPSCPLPVTVSPPPHAGTHTPRASAVPYTLPGTAGWSGGGAPREQAWSESLLAHSLAHLPRLPSAPSFLLPHPPKPGGLSSTLALTLSHSHALCFLSVSDSASRLTFLLSPLLLPSRHFDVVGCTLGLPESLSPTLLLSGVFLDAPSLSQMTPLALLSPRVPKGGGPMAVQGPQKLSWSWGVGHLLSCFSFKCLFSFSLPRPLSPPAAGPHLPMALSGDRKLDVDPYTPCTQDCKQIQAQRKRRQSGWEEEARHG